MREVWEGEKLYIDSAFDLQFFADEEKTEEATPKKKREAREKGQVPKSAELSTVCTLLVGFLALNAFSTGFITRLYEFIRYSFSMRVLNSNLTDLAVHNIFTTSLLFILTCFLPIGIFVLLGGVAVNLLQTGWLFTTETLKFKFDKLNPIAGFKRIFSPRSLVQLVKSVFKLVIVAWVIIGTYRKQALPLAELSLLTPSLQAAARIWQIIIKMIIRICLILLVLAIFDYMYQRYEYRRSLRMTKKEVKEEFKQTEGDPQVKSRIKQKQRQLAMRRMMQQVPKADVVITNPTHLAIALLYDEEKMTAPQVLAKGEGFIANKIKELAQENQIPVVENKPLARMLYKTVEIGDFIPPNLYQAVAEVLAFVYNLRKKRSSV
ncbi:MAG TPA: flagellar biosynthesis protein FlhB [Bacillota bacterium]